MHASRTPEIVECRALGGYGVEWADARRLILSRRDMLYEAREGSAPRPLARVPHRAWMRALARPRALQRLLRFMFYNVLPLPSGDLFATFGRECGVLGADGAFRPVTGQDRPFRVLRGGCALAPDGRVIFGEYIDNADRTPIRIFALDPSRRTLDVLHTFPARTIRHVHGVYADPFAPGLWACAGDAPHECRIIRSSNAFRTHDVVGAGDETWRAVSLQFTPDAVYYGMDAEFRSNFIYRVDRRSGAREVVCEVEGPIYYSARHGDDLFFAVTAELCPSQRGEFAALWRIDALGAAMRLITFSKDALPVRFFLPGTIDFARGDGTRDELLFRTTALRPDNTVFAIR